MRSDKQTMLPLCDLIESPTRAPRTDCFNYVCDVTITRYDRLAEASSERSCNYSSAAHRIDILFCCEYVVNGSTICFFHSFPLLSTPSCSLLFCLFLGFFFIFQIFCLLFTACVFSSSMRSFSTIHLFRSLHVGFRLRSQTLAHHFSLVAYKMISFTVFRKLSFQNDNNCTLGI